MSASRAVRCPWNVCKRLKTTPCRTSSSAHTASFTTASRILQSHDRTASGQVPYQDAIVSDITELAKERGIPIPRGLRERLPHEPDPRLPKNLLALYAAPMKREPTHGIVVCDLQLRSYETRSVEIMADFALRAAYYLNLPAKGPVPLPKIINRWTVPRGNFIHTKSKENFERITLRRLVQIQDGHPDVVQVWLSFLRKYCVWGVGMKANVWENESLGVASRMDENKGAVEVGLESVNWDLFETSKKTLDESKLGRTLTKQGLYSGSKDASSRNQVQEPPSETRKKMAERATKEVEKMVGKSKKKSKDS